MEFADEFPSQFDTWNPITMSTQQYSLAEVAGAQGTEQGVG
jgi:hypothetical protein